MNRQVQRAKSRRKGRRVILCSVRSMSKCVYTFALPYWRRVEAWLFFFLSLSLASFYDQKAKKKRNSNHEVGQPCSPLYHRQRTQKGDYQNEREGGSTFFVLFCSCACDLSLSLFFPFDFPASSPVYLFSLPDTTVDPIPIPRPAPPSLRLLFSLLFSPHSKRKKTPLDFLFCFSDSTKDKKERGHETNLKQKRGNLNGAFILSKQET